MITMRNIYFNSLKIFNPKDSDSKELEDWAKKKRVKK